MIVIRGAGGAREPQGPAPGGGRRGARAGRRPRGGQEALARKVIVRADRLRPYGDVNKIIETCSMVGIYKVEVSAAVPPQS